MKRFKRVQQIIAGWFSRHWKASAIAGLVVLTLFAVIQYVIQTFSQSYGCIIALVTGNGSFC